MDLLKGRNGKLRVPIAFVTNACGNAQAKVDQLSSIFNIDVSSVTPFSLEERFWTYSVSSIALFPFNDINIFQRQVGVQINHAANEEVKAHPPIPHYTATRLNTIES